jgi:hypothetical protein
MADEQPVLIYLSPEEELTSVRERLETTPARRITLVIPPQTQLRSHVGWRLIHARMRELGKELTVISPDRQVRAVARAAGFHVAETQESSPSNRSHLGGGTRPGGISTRGAARSRISSSRGAPESRVPGQPGGIRRQMPPPGERPQAPLPPPEDDLYDEEITLERPGQPDLEPEESQPIAPPPTLFKEPEPHRPLLRDIHISTTPSVRPSVPGRRDDDDDDDDTEKKYDDYYNTGKRVRDWASASSKSEPVEEDNFSTERERGSHGAPARKRWGHDPFAYMEEEQQQASLPEQKGSMPALFDEIGTSVPDISDRSTEIMENEIEYLGDLGAITPPGITSMPKTREESQRPRRPTGQTREESQRPRRPTGQMHEESQRPRTGQTRQHSPRAPRPGWQESDDDELLAIPDRPTQGGRSSRVTGSQRPSQALRPAVLPQPQQLTQRPSQALRPAAQQAQRPSQGLRPAAPPPQPPPAQRPSQGLRSAAPPQPQPGQRGRSGSAPGARTPVFPPSAPTPRQAGAGRPRRTRRINRALTATFIGLFLLVLFLLFYFVPTATVTISLQALSYSQTLQLSASAHPQAGAPNTIQADQLQRDFTASGQGTASGQTSVGDVQAGGKVTFTNNGTTAVKIPTGTVIATQSGIQFTTIAEPQVNPNSSYPAIPIIAQQPGIAGNVAANAITSIPQDSINKIAQYNHISASDIILVVTNPQVTAGGGAKNVHAVTQKNLQDLKLTLHKNLQQQVSAWLATQTRPGDRRGSPVPDLLTSANPLATEQFSGTPGVNTAEESGTFPGTLTLHVSVLVARAAAITAAASNALNAGALKMRQPSILANQLPITLSNENGTASKDGASLSISVKATGAVIKQIDAQVTSSSIAGQSISQAKSGLMAQAGIQDVHISVSPSFLSLMPLSASRIQITFRQIPPVKSVPNG